MRLTKWIIILLLSVMPGLAAGELYMYTDRDGKVHYTDSLDNVPVDQRSDVEEREEVDSQEAPQRAAEESSQEEEPAEVAPEEMDKTDVQTEVQVGSGEEGSLEQQLRQAGEGLREQHQALKEERKQLEAAENKDLTSAARKKLAEKIQGFNARTKDYDQKRQSFNKQVEAYNASIAKEAESSADKKQ